MLNVVYNVLIRYKQTHSKTEEKDMKTMRKGAVVRYIGTADELMVGKVFTVRHKVDTLIEILKPIRYMDGSVHGSVCLVSAKDFELVK